MDHMDYGGQRPALRTRLQPTLDFALVWPRLISSFTHVDSSARSSLTIRRQQRWRQLCVVVGEAVHTARAHMPHMHLVQNVPHDGLQSYSSTGTQPELDIVTITHLPQ